MTSRKPILTASLEDYLETILQLTRDKPVARIRDIAAARNVKPGSVSPAMRRLEEMGFISYTRNEYLQLTPQGEIEARRVRARHDVLSSFFERFLGMEPLDASDQACEMEHHLSDLAMDRLVKLFEFLETCPELPAEFIERFQQCRRINGDEGSCDGTCQYSSPVSSGAVDMHTILDLEPGQSAKVVRVRGSRSSRQRLLDLGILPEVEVRLDRRGSADAPYHILVDMYEATLDEEEAGGIVVSRS